MKILKIEELHVDEPAYDLSVKSSNHNFELSNGVFVHNSLKVPKQFFGFTSDGAGFDGGKSLSILSSRYGKSIKNIQNVLCQMITDLINLFLIDRGLDNYVNKFTVRMQAPITQEELDRRSNTDNRIRYIGDIMNQLTDIEDPVTKLKIYKSLLSSTVNNAEMVGYLQEYIEKLEAEETKESEGSDKKSAPETAEPELANEEEEQLPQLPAMEEVEEDDNKEILNEEGINEDTLPSPADLDMDFSADDFAK